MEENKLHKVGKYGTKETCRDENYSIECAREVFQYLKLHEPIKGWRYMIMEDGVPETMYYKRDGVQIPEDFKVHKIGGNAIERSNKNHRGVFEEKMCYNSSINPYVIFCSGSAFFNKDGVTPNDYFESKFRQMFPYTKNGKPYIWSRNDPHNSSKQMWNQLYLQKERFTKEQKFDILKSVAMQSVKYYRSVLEK